MANSKAGGALLVAYAALAYVLFLASIVWAIGFLLDLGPLPAVGSGHGAPASTGMAVAVDLGLLLLFAVQHSVMARPAFKARLTRVVPAAAERSTFVLAASAVMLAVFWWWQPLPSPIWRLEGPFFVALIAANLAGWTIVVASTFMIDHFDLFGLRQAYLAARGRAYTPVAFRVRALYKFVRHPMMFGLLLAFWAAPVMTAGHLLFAAAGTGYILVGTWFEERDLERSLGPDYANYVRRVPALIPVPRVRA